jgi:hypothetical protein
MFFSIQYEVEHRARTEYTDGAMLICASVRRTCLIKSFPSQIAASDMLFMTSDLGKSDAFLLHRPVDAVLFRTCGLADLKSWPGAKESASESHLELETDSTHAVELPVTESSRGRHRPASPKRSRHRPSPRAPVIGADGVLLPGQRPRSGACGSSSVALLGNAIREPVGTGPATMPPLTRCSSLAP